MLGETIFPRDRVTIVGVLNTTPDSFSDGGRLWADGALRVGAVVDAAAALVEAGAHVLDVGGESTRPGAAPVSIGAETERTAPAIEALAHRFDRPLSIDTRNAGVAGAALSAGARIVNDVSGGRHDPDLARCAADAGAGLVVGHMRGTPDSMQRDPHYDAVLPEVRDELGASVARARAAGVALDRLAVDPGIGFGKRLEDNCALLAHLGWLRDALGLPVWVGVSRKSFLGKLTGAEVGERDLASHCAEAIAIFAGADAVRVHDAAGAREAVAVGVALRATRGAYSPAEGDA